VDTYGKKKAHFFCPKCNVAVDRLSIGNIIEPFWTQLHKIFVYPFQLMPFILMTAVSLCILVLYGLPFIGFILSIGLSFLIVKYAFAILRRTAQGRFSAPKINSDMLTGGISMVLKQIVFYIIIGLANIWVANHMGFVVSFLFQVTMIFFAPAMIIMLVATENLIAAFNPVLFMTMALRIGWSYFLMFLFLVMLKLAPSFVYRYFLSYLPGAIQIFLIPMALIYYLFVAYHLMGYVLLQYHEEIGYDVDVEEDDLIADGTIQKQEGKSEILNQVDILIQDGKTDEAIDLIKEEGGSLKNDVQLVERYYRLLNLKQQIPEMLEQAVPYLDMLLKQKAAPEICKVYRDCAAHDPAFLCSSPTLLKIASFLSNSGKPEEAVQVYSRFIKSNPKSNQVPRAYFLAASVIHEKLKNREKAIGILNAVIKNFPQHEIIPYVQRYLKQMNVVKQSG